MKFALFASALFAAAGLASPVDKHLILYTYESGQDFVDRDFQVRSIIKAATGTEDWICTRALPPTCYPP
ncbi:hypothetical protein JDV02_005805 [Purpureocillium takamizusanense]|uniref:Uncharacterized protein n=1 Tax=Purpureocillium takamizusanense TaxID=2060973 RepID=A0A9Q8QJA2_9HYPO|nr:uncharacterized protein JDV02_005805 [Purpureocillium takamizusanense]UNI19627.1 hypothetical protein JDV02_005805 [Purpureocillium takamizusanense]